MRRVLIAGGGKVGLRLARELRGRCEIRLIELDRQRCEYCLAAELGSEVLVLHGDATDELMTDANVGETDVFIALSSDDEDNIYPGLLSKRLGARRAVSC